MPLREQLSFFIAERLLQNRDAVVDPDESLLERGVVDSVGLLNLITFLESEAGIRVPDNQIIPENFESVVAMEALVAMLRGARG